MKLILTQLMSFHHLSRNITSQHYMSHTFSHHSCTQGSKHNITQSINIDQYKVLCNKYTKTQSNM